MEHHSRTIPKRNQKILLGLLLLLYTVTQRNQQRMPRQQKLNSSVEIHWVHLVDTITIIQWKSMTLLPRTKELNFRARVTILEYINNWLGLKWIHYRASDDSTEKFDPQLKNQHPRKTHRDGQKEPRHHIKNQILIHTTGDTWFNRIKM